MENLLNSMKSLQSTLQIKKGSDIENLTKKQLASFQSKNTSKALTIIYSLQVSLDFDKSPEIAQNLFQIYEYCRVQIINALLKKTKTGLVKAIEVLNDILDGWSNISLRKENV
jgi:flagellar protein FliS